MRPAVPTCACLATLNSQLYNVDVAASKRTRPADACGKVGSRNGGGNRTWGDSVKRVTVLYDAHSRMSSTFVQLTMLS